MPTNPFIPKIWQMEHDICIEHVNANRFHEANDFVRACMKVGVARLKRGEMSEDSGFYVAELANQLAICIEELIREGDVQLARRLPAVVERLSAAQERYGKKVSAKFVAKSTIESLLQKHSAKELLAMARAKAPDLEKMMHWLDWPAIRAMTEDQLRARLVSKTASEPDQKPEPEPLELGPAGVRVNRAPDLEPDLEPLADFIVRISNLGGRSFERANINLFVEHLWQGRLWSGPDKTFEKCPWFGEKKQPLRSDTGTWMKRIRDFLRERTDNDMSKLLVFDTLLARRRAKYARAKMGGTERLRSDDPTYVLDQVMKEIREAWLTMANKAKGKKRKSKATR